jgi:hypothetical protein
MAAQATWLASVKVFSWIVLSKRLANVIFLLIQFSITFVLSLVLAAGACKGAAAEAAVLHHFTQGPN